MTSFAETQPMTPEAALLWLAGLEKPCSCWHIIDQNEGRTGTIRKAPDTACLLCSGSGNAPVLDLRKPCHTKTPCEHGCQTGPLHPAFCLGRGWLPRRGRDALHKAMRQDGWRVDTMHFPKEESAYSNQRIVRFIKKDLWGEYGDDWIAAYKAMLAAGYGETNAWLAAQEL